MDVLVPKSARSSEAAGAERLDVLEARMKEQGLAPESYWWYLDLRRYGTVPHASFGLRDWSGFCNSSPGCKTFGTSFRSTHAGQRRGLTVFAFLGNRRKNPCHLQA